MSEEPVVEQKPAKEPNQATLDRLLRAVELAYHHPYRMMFRSFLHGFMAALGATIGTALFFTILIWVFQALGGLELLREPIERLQEIIIPDEFQAQQKSSDELVREAEAQLELIRQQTQQGQ